MAALESLGRLIGKLTLVVGFIGIGILGIALMVMAVSFPTSIIWRIVVFAMGILAVLIALGTGLTAKNRPMPHTP